MQDEIWKIAITKYFKDFCEFFLPDLNEYIDHSKGYDFLESELQKILLDAKETKRRTDKLVKIYMKNGEEQWILVFTEVQGYKDNTFEERMFTYYYRIYDLYKRKIVALAIFTDKYKNYKPSEYKYDFFGTNLTYKYRIYKALDSVDEDLEKNDNLFALVILAVKYAIRAKNNEDEKLKFKLRLSRLLLEKGYDKTKIIEIFEFINGIIKIQNELKQKLFYEEIKKLEGGKYMAVISDFEEYVARVNMEKGLQKGLEKGLEKGKFEVAKKMLEDGLPVEAIIKYTGLMLENIKEFMKDKDKV